MRGILIGRFQPFHRGHLAVVTEVRRLRPDEPLILGVGSAQASYTLENPFTAGERLEMIEAALQEARLSQVRAYPLTDIERHAVWVAHVESLVPKFDRVYTNNPLTALLFERAGYAVDAPKLVDRERLEGRRIRQSMLEDGPWRDAVPPAVAACIDACSGVPRLRTLAERRAQRPDP